FELKPAGVSVSDIKPREDGISREFVNLLEYHVGVENKEQLQRVLEALQDEELEKIYRVMQDAGTFRAAVEEEQKKFTSGHWRHELDFMAKLLDAGFDFSDPPILQVLGCRYFNNRRLAPFLIKGTGVGRAYLADTYTAFMEPDWSRTLKHGEVSFNCNGSAIGSRRVAICRPPSVTPDDLLVRDAVANQGATPARFATKNILTCAAPEDAVGDCDAVLMSGDQDGDRP
ncbi:unnamed protein product, partial [Amoebophrya sp. A120]